MRKIFSIALALVLVLSLSLATATSVVAEVSDIDVEVNPNTISEEAEYAINFTIYSTLAVGATIYIEFPDEATVPTTGYENDDVTVEGEGISAGDIDVDGQVVTITLPTAISAYEEVTVVFMEDFGIKNPGSRGFYDLYVSTSKEGPGSDDYFINLPNKSTYEFDYDVPETIWVDEWAEVDVTLQTKVKGLEGYNSTQITFNVTTAPEDSEVRFQVYDEDGEEWLPGGGFVDEGQWPDEPFEIFDDYVEAFPFRLRFDTVGVYTIKFALWSDPGVDPGVIEQDEATWAVTGVSANVTLNTGWNLMSLPIIPDDDDLVDVLADIIDDVISVHHYRAATDTWLIYAPPDFNSLSKMKDGEAYWINMVAAANFTVVGQAIAAPGGPPPRTYDVVKGWNMIGFKSMENMTAGDYLAGMEPVRIYGFDLGAGAGGWFSLTSGHNMTPGLGYWVAFSGPGTIYP